MTVDMQENSLCIRVAMKRCGWALCIGRLRAVWPTPQAQCRGLAKLPRVAPFDDCLEQGGEPEDEACVETMEAADMLPLRALTGCALLASICLTSEAACIRCMAVSSTSCSRSGCLSELATGDAGAPKMPPCLQALFEASALFTSFAGKASCRSNCRASFKEASGPC